jgi:hypothetical protein
MKENRNIIKNKLFYKNCLFSLKHYLRKVFFVFELELYPTTQIFFFSIAEYIFAENKNN